MCCLSEQNKSIGASKMRIFYVEILSLSHRKVYLWAKMGKNCNSKGTEFPAKFLNKLPNTIFWTNASHILGNVKTYI